MTPTVDAEFAALCPPLTAEERAGLRDSLIAEGCRDALVVWAETGILLDGHNRLAICEAEGIEYRTVERSFADREAAEDWVLRNQLGRRNLSPDAASLLRGRLYNRQKRERGGTGANQYTEQMYQNEPSATAERLASELGVSPATVKRDGAFARAVEELEPWVPDITERVMAGGVPSRQAVIEAAKEPETAMAVLGRDPMTAQRVDVTIFSSKSDEYYTPAEYIAAVAEVLGGIDLDPASCELAQATVGAKRYYTKADDGLAQPWEGRVYLNPPYGTTGGESNQGIWAQRLVEAYTSGAVTGAVLLVKAALGYEWFEELWYRWPVCFPRRRLSFGMPDGSGDGQSKQGSALFYFGREPERFAEHFRRFGRVIWPEVA